MYIIEKPVDAPLMKEQSVQQRVIVYVGVGSNLDDPADHILAALDELEGIRSTCCMKCSQLYISPPMGPADQPDYINAVASLETKLKPYSLLLEFQVIELKHGRVRGRRWGERTLDLDLLLYADLIFDDPKLTIPHPGIRNRAFVLYPLQEIAPDLVLPGGDFIGNMVAACPKDGLKCYE